MPSEDFQEQADGKLQLDAELRFKYWSKCEDVAMHFNELAVRFRLQALGGLAVVSGVLGFARGAAQVDWTLLGAALLCLCLFWAAAFAIDHVYYSRLLKGAVEELLRVETRSDMQLSTQIEKLCDNGKRATHGRHWYYGLPAVALIAAAVLCFMQS